MVAALCLVALHKSTVQLFKLYALPSFTNIDAVIHKFLNTMQSKHHSIILSQIVYIYLIYIFLYCDIRSNTKIFASFILSKYLWHAFSKMYFVEVQYPTGFVEQFLLIVFWHCSFFVYTHYVGLQKAPKSFYTKKILQRLKCLNLI